MNFLTKQLLLRSILASAVVGVSFSVPSFIYDHIPKSYQMLFHMGIGYLVFFPLAFYAHGIPVDAGIYAVIGTILFMIIVSFSIWLGFYFYYKRKAKLINQSIQKKRHDIDHTLTKS